MRADLGDPFQGHLKQAMELYNQQRFQESLAELQAAYALYPLPRLQFNLAQVHRKLGHTKEALESYELFLRTEPHIRPEQRAEVEHRIAELRPPQEAPAPAPSAAPPSSAPEPAAVAPKGPQLVVLPPPPGPAPREDRGAARFADDHRGAARGPIYKRWWFWGAIGVVAAGAAAGIVAGTYHAPPAIPMDIPFHTEKWTPQ